MIPRRVLLVVVFLAAAPPGHAMRFDFRTLAALTTGNGAGWSNCGILIFDNLWTEQGVGIGVLGGSSDATVDTNESVEVRLSDANGDPVARRGVHYSVETAGNENGNGTFGDGFVEAFDAANTSLGVVAVHGVGLKDLDALFGGVPIRRFVLTASGDGVRIAFVEYDLPPGELARIETGGTGLIDSSPAELCDVVLSGSANVHAFAGFLGIAGGLEDIWIDTAEYLSFQFPYPVTGVVMATAAVSNENGNGLAGEAFLEGFDAAGSLGVQAISTLDSVPVNDLFGGVPITGFQVTANADGRSVSSVSFAPEPNQLSAGLAVLAACAWCARRRAAERGSPAPRERTPS